MALQLRDLIIRSRAILPSARKAVATGLALDALDSKDDMTERRDELAAEQIAALLVDVLHEHHGAPRACDGQAMADRDRLRRRAALAVLALPRRSAQRVDEP